MAGSISTLFESAVLQYMDQVKDPLFMLIVMVIAHNVQ